jgi:septal ring factor EnvC (AmiA/AmiB activator)
MMLKEALETARQDASRVEGALQEAQEALQTERHENAAFRASVSERERVNESGKSETSQLARMYAQVTFDWPAVQNICHRFGILGLGFIRL